MRREEHALLAVIDRGATRDDADGRAVAAMDRHVLERPCGRSRIDVVSAESVWNAIAGPDEKKVFRSAIFWKNSSGRGLYRGADVLLPDNISFVSVDHVDISVLRSDQDSAVRGGRPTGAHREARNWRSGLSRGAHSERLPRRWPVAVRVDAMDPIVVRDDVDGSHRAHGAESRRCERRSAGRVGPLYGADRVVEWSSGDLDARGVTCAVIHPGGVVIGRGICQSGIAFRVLARRGCGAGEIADDRVRRRKIQWIGGEGTVLAPDDPNVDARPGRRYGPFEKVLSARGARRERDQWIRYGRR